MKQKLKEISLHLLDLGKRNRLINYKTSGYRNIDILNKNIEILFEKIISGNWLSIYNIDPVLQKYNKTIDGTNESIEEYSKLKVFDIINPLLKANDILCYKEGYSLNIIIKVMYKEYQDTLIEKGINTLYMTFGMVSYQEKNETFLAPLLLIPLTMDFNNKKIKESDDEIILNPTLSYLLETNYKIHLDEFVEGQMNLKDYLLNVEKILINNKMSLNYNISIGIYSFLKMNMFNDIRNNMDIILKNNNILNLLGQPSFKQINEKLKIYPVVGADESQLEAIKAATNGDSFVLQGPPGTGKSQTITNMISSLIANNKKVLFVSEKQAALNVVYENLKRAQISEFAIELHSHKANKKEFIEELYKTAILPKYDINNCAADYDQKYEYLTSVLDDYRKTLHNKIDRLGLSMYEIYSNYLNVKTDFTFKLDNIIEYNLNDLDEIKLNLDKYANLSKSLGYDYHKGAFYGFITKDIEYIRYDAKKDLIDLYEFYKSINDIKKLIIPLIPFKINSYKNVIDALPYLDKIVQLNCFLSDYFIKDKRNILLNDINEYRNVANYIRKSTLKKFINLDIIKTNDLETYTNEFREIKKSKLRFFKPGYYKLKKAINAYTNLKMNDDDLLKKLEESCIYKNKIISFNRLKKKLPYENKMGDYELYYNDCLSLNDFDFDLNLNEEKYLSLKKGLIDILYKFSQIKKINLNIYIDKFDSNVFNLIEGNLDDIVVKLKDMIDSIELLNIHSQRLEVLKYLEDKNVISFLDYAIENKLALKQLSKTFESIFYEANILYEFKNNTIYKDFSSMGIDSILEEFKRLDEMHLELNKAYIVSKLSSIRPDESIMIGSKFAILVSEYNKSRRQKPIRVLLEEIFDLILDIKPVFLMSPLSVSTYLNSKIDMFDAVIFDEASQVFAWDALGAIYRAKQCIIIGDSKQMPPSNFFSSSVDDEEYDNDLESILDKGSSAFKTKRLNWHYRSRSEELIAFSNENFYDSRLITIPQAKKHQKGFGIDFYHVMGTYEVKTRVNRKEANYIVDLIKEHITSRSDKSLGVVAFSNAQAELIWDLTEERLMNDPLYREFFSQDKKEPFFVKNLESVQGDERDVIIFSICYGYNSENKFYQRFGPLNVLGGERRLNVAITRAKENVCVVSSILSSDIKLEQTESVGVKMLKYYLDYAYNSSTPKQISFDSKDGVINSITRFLNKEGYLVETNLGKSKFKIDMAIVDRNTLEYTTAIMVDGPSYSIGNCSDANRLQEQLLKRLGWKFIRIFSTDWVLKENQEKQRILDFIKNDNMNIDAANNIDNLLIKIENNFDDSFDVYPYVKEEEIKAIYDNNPNGVIKYIVSKEEPIHIDYLLKRICFIYGRLKVTNVVKQYFNDDISKLNLHIDNNFISINSITNCPLRIRSDRDIEYIHRFELMDGIYKVTKKSNGITKEGCFKNVLSLLGYDRMSERAEDILEDALTYLKLEGKIIEKQDCLYV